MSETIRFVATLVVAIAGGVTIGLVVVAAIIDHTTFTAACRARATVGRQR